MRAGLGCNGILLMPGFHGLICVLRLPGFSGFLISGFCCFSGLFWVLVVIVCRHGFDLVVNW